MLALLKRIIPSPIIEWLRPLYHYTFACLGAFIYRFPSKHIDIVAVTGTKGKSSTVEIINAILEEAGFTTAIAGTIRFKIADKSRPNMFKMTMPGRFFMQKFLRQAVDAKCQYAIVEMTSEGARQHRHAFIDMNALVFLNLAPEHIESHGGYEKYRDAKVSLARALASSKKQRTILVVNGDDKESKYFLDTKVKEKYTFNLSDAEPYTLSEKGITMTVDGKTISSHLEGLFNISNILSAITYTKTQDIPLDTVASALQKLTSISGRVEHIKVGQPFDVIVDYAHTPESLKALYGTFPDRRKICVLGNTGGGRDTWKRPEMAKIAENYCDDIILTNEDPYDENPRKIVEDMAKALTTKTARIIMNRREAIREALKSAKQSDVVLITGKGTDPYIMEANGKKTPWSDKKVAEEELSKIVEAKKAESPRPGALN